jgi:cytochrome c550
MADKLKDAGKTGEGSGVSPVLFGLAFGGILLAAILVMLLITAGDTKETPAPASLSAVAQEGKTLYITTGNCNTCHPGEGRKAGIGPRLSTGNISDDNIRKFIRNGKGAMPANSILSEDDITKIIAYLRAIKP